jgi:hypothetical protein
MHRHFPHQDGVEVGKEEGENGEWMTIQGCTVFLNPGGGPGGVMGGSLVLGRSLSWEAYLLSQALGTRLIHCFSVN